MRTPTIGALITSMIIALLFVALAATPSGAAEKAKDSSAVSNSCSLKSMYSSDDVRHGNGKPYITVTLSNGVHNEADDTLTYIATAKVKKGIQGIRLCGSSAVWINDREAKLRMWVRTTGPNAGRLATRRFTVPFSSSVAIVATARRVQR